jgi:polyhydroxybutyrate depolymerase
LWYFAFRIERAADRISSSVRRLAYTNWVQNADVILYTIEDGGHAWPGAEPRAEPWAGRTTIEINATRIMSQFFMQHPHD